MSKPSSWTSYCNLTHEGITYHPKSWSCVLDDYDSPDPTDIAYISKADGRQYGITLEGCVISDPAYGQVWPRV